MFGQVLAAVFEQFLQPVFPRANAITGKAAFVQVIAGPAAFLIFQLFFSSLNTKRKEKPSSEYTNSGNWILFRFEFK